MSLEIESEESTDSYESTVMVLPSGGPHDYSELNNRFGISPFSETREGALSVLVTGKNLMPIRYPRQNIALRQAQDQTDAQLQKELRERDETHLKHMKELEEAHLKELRERDEARLKELRERDEAHLKELRERDEARLKELRERDEAHKKEVTELIEANQKELWEINEAYRKEQWELQEKQKVHDEERITQLLQVLTQLIKDEIGPRVENTIKSDQTQDDHRNETEAKLLLPATPTKEENDLVYEATPYEQEDQTALRPDTLVDFKRLNTIQTSDSSSVEPSPLEMDLTAPSLQDLCFFNSIM